MSNWYFRSYTNHVSHRREMRLPCCTEQVLVIEQHGSVSAVRAFIDMTTDESPFVIDVWGCPSQQATVYMSYHSYTAYVQSIKLVSCTHVLHKNVHTHTHTDCYSVGYSHVIRTVYIHFILTIMVQIIQQ